MLRIQFETGNSVYKILPSDVAMIIRTMIMFLRWDPLYQKEKCSFSFVSDFKVIEKKKKICSKENIHFQNL